MVVVKGKEGGEREWRKVGINWYLIGTVYILIPLCRYEPLVLHTDENVCSAVFYSFNPYTLLYLHLFFIFNCIKISSSNRSVLPTGFTPSFYY